jgi:hypothetical protein
MSMKLILIGAIVICALPFLVLGALAVFAALGISSWRRQADALGLPQSGSAPGAPSPDSDPAAAPRGATPSAADPAAGPPGAGAAPM